MNPNERAADPPSPDATAPDPEWVDPWSWRAYRDELSQAPEEARAAEGSDTEAPTDPEQASRGRRPPEPEALAERTAPSAPAEATAAAEPEDAEEAVVTPDWAQPVGPSDWDERVRLLEGTEPVEARAALPPPRPAPPRSLVPQPAPPRRQPPYPGGWGPPADPESPWGVQPAPSPARPARTRRRGWIIVLAIVAALAIMAVQLVQLGVLGRQEPTAPLPPGAQRTAPGAAAPTRPAPPLSPRAQVMRLLANRAGAVLRHDRAAFLATVDRRRRGFYRSQAVLFDRMVTVPFASFSYSVPDPLQDVGTDRARQRYSPTVVSMLPVEARFRFRGQDSSPFLAHYYYTFAVTPSGWRIAGQDEVPRPLRSDVEIWDGGPVRSVSTSRTLVVFHPGDADLAGRLLTVAERGYGQVAASWSASWDRKVVILVPGDQREAQRLVRSRDLSDVAAVTSSAIEAGPLHRLLGNRIIVNTSLVQHYRMLDLQVVLTHEMTHVATRKIGVGVPLYLAEGFADYTALRPLDAPVRVTRPSLALAVRVGRFTGRLPSRSQLVGDDAALAYDEGSTFCLWVATTYGEARLQTLYSSFRDLTDDADRRDEDLRFRRVLGISRATAEARWAAFARGTV